MSAQLIDFDARRVEPYLMEAVLGFLSDPPDSEFQRGYLAAILAVYQEGIGRGSKDARIERAEALLTPSE